MAFGDDSLVELAYNVNVTGQEQLDEVIAQNAALQGQIDTYKAKLNDATAAQNAHTNSVVSAGRELNQLRRAFIGLLLPITADVAILNEMAKGSETIASSLETSGRQFATWAGQVGNSIAFAAQVWGAMSTGMNMQAAIAQANATMANTTSMKTQIAELQLKAQTEKDAGDDLAALQTKQQAERLQLQEKYQGDAYARLKPYLDQKQQAEMDAYKLSELGLENHNQIMRGLDKDLVSGFQSDTGGIIGDFISGKPQTGSQMIQDFRDTIGKSVGDAISKTLFTTMFQGGGIGDFFKNFTNIFTGQNKTPAVVAAEKTNQILTETSSMTQKMQDCICSAAETLKQIAECTCYTAQSISAAIPTSATVTMPGPSTAQKIASITGLAGDVLGLGGSLGGGVPSGGSPSPSPSITDASSFQDMSSSMPMPSLPDGMVPAHSGMEIPAFPSMHQFPSGGEVPIMAQPGEFVVRRAAAQGNKDLLKSINSGAIQSNKSSNVYYITSNDAKSFSDMLASPSAQAQMELQITKAILKNGSLRDAIRSHTRT